MPRASILHHDQVNAMASNIPTPESVRKRARNFILDQANRLGATVTAMCRDAIEWDDKVPCLIPEEVLPILNASLRAFGMVVVQKYGDATLSEVPTEPAQDRDIYDVFVALGVPTYRGLYDTVAARVAARADARNTENFINNAARAIQLGTQTGRGAVNLEFPVIGTPPTENAIKQFNGAGYDVVNEGGEWIVRIRSTER